MHTFVNYLEISPIAHAVSAFSNTPSADLFSSFVNKNQSAIKEMDSTYRVLSTLLQHGFDNPTSTLTKENLLRLCSNFFP